MDLFILDYHTWPPHTISPLPGRQPLTATGEQNLGLAETPISCVEQLAYSRSLLDQESEGLVDLGPYPAS